jgi:adenylate kinase family enzyme
MSLPGRKPAIEENKRAKIILSGPSGSGKSLFASKFPNAYYWAPEDGADRPQYQKMLLENNSTFIGRNEGSQDFKLLIESVKELATTKHNYKNLVIDSFSKIYLLTAAMAEEKIGSDFGKDKKEANRPTRQLMRWLDKLDMNVILICHQKDKWERKNNEIINVGTTFDGYDKLEYELDLWIETKIINGQYMFEVKKSRLESMPKGMIKSLDYKTFSELYGVDAVEHESKPILLSTSKQISRVKEIIELFNISEEDQAKWLKKVDAETFSDVSQESVQKFINYYESKMKPEVKK